MSKKKGKTPKKPRKLKADWRKQYQRPQPAMQGIAQQSQTPTDEPQPNPLNLVAEIPEIPEIPKVPKVPTMMEELEEQIRKEQVEQEEPEIQIPGLPKIEEEALHQYQQPSTSPQPEEESSQELPGQPIAAHTPETESEESAWPELASVEKKITEELEKIKAKEDLTPSGTSEAKEDEKAKELYRLATAIRDYCVGHSIALVLKAICEQVPEALPNYRTWSCKVDPVDVIRDIIHTKNYVESLIPSLRMMMGDNVRNIQWSARVIIAMTTFHAIRTITWQESGAAITGTFESEEK